jgi:hypothetical protein
MSDNEAEVLSISQSMEIVGEEERDHEFFNALRAPSITKDTIINLSSDRIRGIRSQVRQLESVVTDLRSTITDLRSAITELKQNTVSSDPQSVNMTANSQINNNTTSSPVFHNHQPTATLNVEKSNIKATQPESFSGEKTRLVNDWLAAVKRYLMLSGAEETKWVAYAVTMFTSTALNWWNSVEFSNPEKSILDYSWREFVELVRERFVPVDSEAVAMSKMSRWKQTGSVVVLLPTSANFRISTNSFLKNV